ncbi:F-box/kelch-repeat protein [Forsythia ovata]|uniref:F-box/kelch-repeat protein n=1 Tax=Forsythia ovata TaxID=205694 RepID=A0ABD1V2K7_9LAMI
MASEEGIIIPILPQEIIIEVLLRLPVKSLVKFRCVCKPWLSLISSPQFAKTHLKISSEKNKGEHDRLVLGCTSDYGVFLRSINLDSFMHGKNFTDAAKVYGHEMDVNFPRVELRMIGSCNGLICISVGSCGVFLWNPSIRKSKVLPPSGSEFRNYSNTVTYGFGYDELNDDYKVAENFGFATDAYSFSAKLKIFSLRTNSWKEIENWPGAYPSRRRARTCAFVNGAFHWSGRPNGRWQITSLNTETELYGEISLPEYEIGLKDLTLGVLRKCLCVFYNYKTHLDIWMMKKYGVRESWTKLVCIMDIQDNVYQAPVPLYASESGIILMKYGSTFKLYNSADNNTSTFLEISSPDPQSDYKAITYTESLVLPNSDHEGNQHWRQWGTKDDDWDYQHLGSHGDLVDSAQQLYLTVDLTEMLKRISIMIS